jgi:hypothetical protein
MEYAMKMIGLMTVAVGLGLSGALAQVAPGPENTTTSAPASARGAAATGPRIIWERVVHDVDNRRPEPERLIVWLRLTPDPAQPLAYVQRLTKAQKAVDDQGRSLAFTGELPHDLRVDTLAGGGLGSQLVQVILQPPGTGGERPKSIAVLEGVISAATVGKTDAVDLAVPGKETREYAGGVKGTFSTSMAGAGLCRVEYLFEVPANLPAAERANWSSQSVGLRLKVVDADGNNWMPSGGGTSTGGTTRFGTNQTYAPMRGGTPGGVPKVHMEWVTQAPPIEIPFKVENIPLP